MIKVNKKYSKIPGQIGYNKKHNDRLIKIFNGTGTINSDKIYNTIYGDKLIRKKLSTLYNDKCAYCETKDPEFEIEHYRPKKSVSGISHPGYFWLCYEWSNLIPACHACNNIRSKSTKFPIIGKRVSAPVIKHGQYIFSDHNLLSRRLKREVPMLIHPEEPDFDPFDFFKFDFYGKMLSAAHKNSIKHKRALATIEEIVRLNREKLYLHERGTDLERYRKRWLGIFMIYLENYLNHGKIVAVSNLEASFFETLSEIKMRSNPIHEYSFFWEYVYKEVYFFLPKDLKKRPKDRTRFLQLITRFKSFH